MISIQGVSCYYNDHAVLRNVNLEIPGNRIYAFIGPSGCGKTTLLRSLNRMNDLIPSFRLEGTVRLFGDDVYAMQTIAEVKDLRKRIGMIFQQPNPLPTSVMKNMLMPVQEHYHGSGESFRDKVVEKLKIAALYDEISARLDRNALSLSGGQQQRLCIARALMLEPGVMLFDEPCSALDPIATYKIEDMLTELKKICTIVIVTHNMEQAKRIADQTAFFYQGEIVEAGETEEIFNNPKADLLYRYISGKF
ncbi:MAG: phosphate ABC transporter ATP-binding protein [Clostridiales bacterium]|nr:phosphate ABC transporter ATP-binding protein [Clostridiales bacterium]